MTTRIHEKIPYAEIEPLLNLAKNPLDTNETEVLNTIGYSNNSAFDWRHHGQAPLRAKYSLLGLPAELKIEKPAPSPMRLFNFDELSDLFAGLNGMAVPTNRVNKLRAKIAALMVEDTPNIRDA